MQLKVAICDDEMRVVQEVRRGLEILRPDCDIVEFHSGMELLRSRQKFDVIFLDIEMPQVDGMKTAAALREAGCNSFLVFLTSHTEMMQEAFWVRAFRFLVKPVNMEKLREVLLAVTQEMSKEESVVLNKGGKTVRFRLRDIVYIEAYGDGVYIHDRDGEVYDMACQLKGLMKELGDEYFFRIHKSTVVSFQYVKMIEQDGTVVLSKGSISLKASRRCLPGFRRAYFEFIKKHAEVNWR